MGPHVYASYKCIPGRDTIVGWEYAGDFPIGSEIHHYAAVSTGPTGSYLSIPSKTPFFCSQHFFVLSIILIEFKSID